MSEPRTDQRIFMAIVIGVAAMAIVAIVVVALFLGLFGVGVHNSGGGTNFVPLTSGQPAVASPSPTTTPS